MQTLCWLIALLANLGVIAAFASSAFEGHIVGISASALFLVIAALLVAARLGHPPAWGHKVMLSLCLAVPVLAFVGSLDLGIISGQEFVSIVVAVLLGFGSWRAYLLFAPRPNTAVKRRAPYLER